jgi:hypothetical protein
MLYKIKNKLIHKQLLRKHQIQLKTKIDRNLLEVFLLNIN